MASADHTQQFPRRVERVVFGEADEEQVLLDPDTGEYFALNEVGARIWALCDGTHSRADIAQALTREYDADEQTITADVRELLDELLKEGLIAQSSRDRAE